VLIGYTRISKADGRQTLDLQRDALLAAGVEPGHRMPCTVPSCSMTCTRRFSISAA
jgi:hypothetical protein